MDLVEQAERTSLSKTDLKDMLQHDARVVDILDYADLANFNSLQQLIPAGKDAVIILLQIQSRGAPLVGHWIAMIKKVTPGTTEIEYEHFDPYGLKIDQELAITQERPFLTNLVQKARDGGFRVQESGTQFQALREHVNTCGRWCVVRVMMRDKTIVQFQDFMDTNHFNGDQTVTLMTFLSELK